MERVQRTGALTCFTVGRPGFAEISADGAGHGPAADLCQKLARAVAGSDAKGSLDVGELEDEVKDADLAFIAAESGPPALAGRMIPLAVVFRDPVTLLVPETSPVKLPADLAGRSVCLMVGSPGQRALEEGLSRLSPPVMRQSFSEDVEMLDAYNVGQCDAMVGEASTLSVMQRQRGINGLRSRMLAQPLSEIPIVAAVPVADGAWASRVGWALQSVLGLTP